MATEFWTTWGKPWTRAQCQRVYVESEKKISLRKLGELSGIRPKTIEHWYYKDSWKEERASYHGQIGEKLREKTIEKLTDRLSDEATDVQVQHFEDYRTFRQLVMLKIKYLVRRCSEDQPFERLEAELEKISPLALNFLSLVLDRSVKGERVALGMEYEDYNRAIQTLTAAGFEVIVPEDMADLSKAVNHLTESVVEARKGNAEVT